ncbi:MAG: hypothetical protein QME60_05225 [Verrucomicrobiota bacterium]|nr:hypothetical protein [Verrucomicrobiota bacterium]
MQIVVDAHVHFYPCYRAAEALRGLADNLARLGGAAACLACLAERAGGRFFTGLKTGRTVPTGPGFRVRTTADAEALMIEQTGRPLLALVAGRQVVTAERLEILTLMTDASIPDGLPALEVAEQTTAVGGIPVLAWAPGKWLLSRSRVARDLIERAQPGQLAVGDTALRPTVWGEPRLMRLARRKGLPVLAGSDPLPFAGDDRWMGAYASLIEGEFDPERPAMSLRRALTGSATMIRPVGRRGGFLTVLRRLRAYARARSNAA